MRLIRVLATSAIALVPTGTVGAPPRFVSCPMPVSVPDSGIAGWMPIYRGNAAIPMPTQRLSCSNPLFAPKTRASRDASATH